MRAFLAIPVLPPALEPFQALRARLVEEVAVVRWTPAESPHITLHFFGSIDEQQARAALEAVRPVIAARKPFPLRLRGLGAFPGTGDARVLWCGVEDDERALPSCADACTRALVAVGFTIEERPFRPHCTLGRPRQPWPAGARTAWRRRVEGNPGLPGFTADRAILYESVAAPIGVRHVPRALLPLGAGA